MIQRIVDDRFRFVTLFNSENGAYMRSGILDDDGNDTGVDPFKMPSKVLFQMIAMIMSTSFVDVEERLTASTKWLNQLVVFVARVL